jgi:murein DD-endopeptidase MepM/ murein hydrolase activator NlpD
MLANSRMVQVGDKVSQGQQIGEVGSTGNSTGNHLHFEVRTNNGKNCVDPKPYLK